MDEKELKPCPFCGSADVSEGEVLTSCPNGGASTQSMCRGCGALGPDAHLREGEVDFGSEKATAAWNRRAALAPSDAAQAPEAAAYLVTGLNECNEEWASAWIKRGNADAAAARLYRGAVTPLYAAPVAPAAAAPIPLLAADHKGMRVDYSGVFKHAATALARGGKEPGLAEMLRQMKEHITELGQRWYAGDTAVVDELLQLYCVEKDARDALVAASGAAQ